MTREELKEHCKKQIEMCEMWAKAKGEEPCGKVYEEHKLILELLEQEPYDDAISRQIISDYVESHIQEINTGYGDLNKHTNEILRMIVNYIESMPPVTPQPKIGHWINDDGDNAICSCCNRLNHLYGTYCKHCGAKMEMEE